MTHQHHLSIQFFFCPLNVCVLRDQTHRSSPYPPPRMAATTSNLAASQQPHDAPCACTGCQLAVLAEFLRKEAATPRSDVVRAEWVAAAMTTEQYAPVPDAPFHPHARRWGHTTGPARHRPQSSYIVPHHSPYLPKTAALKTRKPK